MPLDLVTVPCLADNFAFLLHDPATGATALVDAPEAAPVQAALAARRWRLGLILLTHHHDDHVQAVPDLRAGGVPVWGAAADAHRLPPLDRALHPGDAVAVGAEEGRVIDVPGHTVGHIAFHFPGSALAFTGDSLMAAGCGRLFEGTAAQMWNSLSRLAALPGATRVCSGHDYLKGNLAFAQSVDAGNPALAARIATVAAMRREGRLPMPWTLAEERATNPFLRASDPGLKAALGMADAPDAQVFAELRRRKDQF
jgi:hydroxyacylglutathione hydrolase